MAYNSMDAMLMGGILPADIDDGYILTFIRTPFKKAKTIKFGNHTSTGNSWMEIIFNMYSPEVRDEAAASIVEAIGHFLRASAQYGLIGGPRALAQLRAARIALIGLNRPGVDIAIRIMKDMRKSDINLSNIYKQAFLEEPDALKAIRRMRFAPGFGYYKDQLTALPQSLQLQAIKYVQNPVRRQAAALRARRKALAIKNFAHMPDSLIIPQGAPDQLSRTRGDFGILHPVADPRYREIAQKIQRTRAAKIGAEYSALPPEFRLDI